MLAEAVSLRAIANLIVVLEIAQKSMRAQITETPAMPPPPVGRKAAVIDKGAPQRARQIGQRAEVFIVAESFARQHGVKAVMKVVAPLRIQRHAAAIARPQKARV